MVYLKNKTEIDRMRIACAIAALALKEAEKYMIDGISTYELDKILEKKIRSYGATPSFKGYGGFPASTCLSINDEVIHGIPSKKRFLRKGDIVSVDVGAIKNGFHGDCANTYTVGTVSDKAKKLIDITRQSFFEGISFAVPGNRLGDIGAAIDSYVVKNGCTTVKDYVGHGIGREMHEDPSIPNYGTPGKGLRLESGMTLAIEPMVNAGVYGIKVLSDGWTVKTLDGSLSAHYENTIVITDDGHEILTVADENKV